VTSSTVTVNILDREYQVNCKTEEIDELTSTAKYLDGEMKKIRDTGKVLGMDRIAVMAALNISHDYLSLNKNSSDTKQDNTNRISTLTSKIEQSLARQKQFALS
jgi:cell division protein ZapA